MPQPVLHNVQRLRFVAAFAVLLSHAAGWLIPDGRHYRWFWSIPWTAGVDLFFVISGFIMVLLSRDRFGTPGAARHFLARRIVRIVPPYWFFTTVTLVLLLAVGMRAGQPTVDPIHAAASYAFLPWPGPDDQLKPILAQGWTLNYEAFFYAAFALALYLRRGLPLLGAALVVLALAHRFVPSQAFIPAFWTDPIILEFAAGMILATVYLRGMRLSRVGALIGLALAIIAAIAPAYLPFPAERFWTLGIPAAIAAASVILAPEPTAPGAIGRLVERGGDASYTIYLAHYLIVYATSHAWLRAGIGLPWLGVAVGVIVALAVSIAFYERVERPVTDALRRRPGALPLRAAAR